MVGTKQLDYKLLHINKLSVKTALTFSLFFSHDKYERTVPPAKTYCLKFIVSPYSSKSRFKSFSKHISVFKIDCISFDVSNTF